MTAQSASPLHSRKPRRILSALALCAAVLAPLATAQTSFTPPTAEELSMTSVPGYPGVAAVILNKEEITRDGLHSATHYARIKILTEEGKKYANVELPFVSSYTDSSDNSVITGKSLESIHGRTIHPDGAIIPFTGKPYLKIIEKGKGINEQAKVFTLPDVTVGSIIEYRYNSFINDNYYEPPIWIIQGDLFTRSAHFLWYPATGNILDQHNNQVRTITSFPILPKGAEVIRKDLPVSSTASDPTRSYELTIQDVPPVPDDEVFMPPLANYSYRVYFNYSSDRTSAEFWKNEGRYWSKSINAFANPSSDLKAATQQIIAGATTEDQKLRAIYAAVQKLENTDFTRQQNKQEGEINNAGDVLKHQRGSSDQLAKLFIAMARATGLEADAMFVPDRSREFFIPDWLEMSQFDDILAIVNLNGKDQYFDPGSRYCPYGHLAWQHSFVTGLRQKGNDTSLENLQGDDYNDNAVLRAGNLIMDATGHITGGIEMTFSGAPALTWRHTALRGDDESLKHELRTSLEEMIPQSLEVKDVAVSSLADYEQPLKVTYTVEGTLGAWTGKRLILPADIFLANQKATFPHEKRDIAVDFHYPRLTRDALRIILPANISLEAAPHSAQYSFKKGAAYGMAVDTAANNFTTRRDYVLDKIYILPDEYTQLRTFYSQLETNDQQTIILKTSAAPTTTASATPATN